MCRILCETGSFFRPKLRRLVPYVKEDFFVKDKKNTPQVLARRALLVLLDAAIVAFSFYFALLLRADGAVEATWWPHNRAHSVRKPAVDRGGVHCLLSGQAGCTPYCGSMPVNAT